MSKVPPHYTPWFGYGESSVHWFGEIRNCLSKHPGLNLELLPHRRVLLCKAWRKEWLLFAPASLCKILATTRKDADQFETQYTCRWGFRFNHDRGDFSELVVQFGHVRKSVSMPWALTFHREMGLMPVGCCWGASHVSKCDIHPDGFWVELPKANATIRLPSWRFQFKRKGKYNNVDNTMATVCGEARIWRRHWLPFTDLWSFRRNDIEIKFDKSVGDRAGSWNGGLCATGFGMNPGETVEQTYNRFCKEYDFSK